MSNEFVKFTGSKGEYEVQGWSVETGQVKNRDDKIGITYTIHLKRNIQSIMMVTYLPTLLMNLINQATNFLSSQQYELIITVNITCMMVLTSVYLSVSTSLPRTSNIKPVEWWLIFNLAYPFLVILVNVVIQVEILKYFKN